MSCLRFVSKGGVVGGVVFSTILRDLDGGKEDRLDEGNDLTRSTIAGFRGATVGEGVGLRYSCWTKEGSVIVDKFSDRFEPPSKV